jgi:hypothetical protein
MADRAHDLDHYHYGAGIVLARLWLWGGMGGYGSAWLDGLTDRIQLANDICQFVHSRFVLFLRGIKNIHALHIIIASIWCGLCKCCNGILQR